MAIFEDNFSQFKSILQGISSILPKNRCGSAENWTKKRHENKTSTEPRSVTLQNYSSSFDDFDPKGLSLEHLFRYSGRDNERHQEGQRQ